MAPSPKSPKKRRRVLKQFAVWIPPHTIDQIRAFGTLWRCSQGKAIATFVQHELAALLEKDREKDRAYFDETLRRLQEKRKTPKL